MAEIVASINAVNGAAASLVLIEIKYIADRLGEAL